MALAVDGAEAHAPAGKGRDGEAGDDRLFGQGEGGARRLHMIVDDARRPDPFLIAGRRFADPEDGIIGGLHCLGRRQFAGVAEEKTIGRIDEEVARGRRHVGNRMAAEAVAVRIDEVEVANGQPAGNETPQSLHRAVALAASELSDLRGRLRRVEARADTGKIKGPEDRPRRLEERGGIRAELGKILRIGGARLVENGWIARERKRAQRQRQAESKQQGDRPSAHCLPRKL
ncbi:hypothetical protein CLD20_18405 [Afifella sp. IM 167]|nr:hypothetical protein [Afifella sp. IM 167]